MIMWSLNKNMLFLNRTVLNRTA